MSIGAKDYIDQLLVRKYANEKVNNHNITQLAVPPDRMLQTMNDYADSHRQMLALQNKLQNACKGVNLKFAYQRS